MAAEQDPGLWREIISGALAAVTAVFSWLFKDVHERIKKAQEMAEDAMSKEEFNEHRERAVQERRDLRDDVKELFSRDEKMKDLFNERFEDLRREMHEGFDKISREIRTREGRT